MSHSSSIFNRVPIDLPNRSGFNLDHENLFTATCGTLIPAYCKPVLPKDTLSMGVNFQCQLPPMVTDFYGKVDAVFEAFFVPNRILWQGWEDFITHPTNKPIYPEGTHYRTKPTRKPTIKFSFQDAQSLNDSLYLGPGSLADYLGLKLNTSALSSQSDVFSVDMLPFLAYHMIYHHWYRDSRIQAPVFVPPASSDTPLASTIPAACLPYVGVVSSQVLTGPVMNASAFLGDGQSLYQLRQRNWSKGYFTAASPYPQAGGEEEITFDVGDSGEGSISIAAIRSANSLQRWKERNNFSYEYADQIYAHYGIYPDSAKMDKPIYLGRCVESVYSRSVFQTSPSDIDVIDGVVGSKKASSQSIGEGSLFQDFTPSEHGFLVVLFSLVPHAYYSSGSARHLSELDSEDIPFPLLAGMGDQPIYVSELAGTAPDSSALSDGTASIFGYIDRYAHYKYDEDEVHGELRDVGSLYQFALQRSFGGSAELGSVFLQIPVDAMDQVQAVGTSSLGYSCWVDAFFKFSKVSTLPAYSVPTLGDIKNTHKGYVSRGGSRL